MTPTLDVLIVEDEPVVREAARKILAEEGLSSALAHDVDDAIATLEGTRCRVVLSDLMLPGASGLDLLDLTRKRWPGTEVVVITGYATLDNALAAFRRGAFDFVPKPFDIGELLSVVRRALRFSARSRELRSGPAASPARLSDQVNQSWFLGRHSWAGLHADGWATLGVAETFPHLMGAIERVELPAAEEHLTQGKLLARIFDTEENVYRVWSPLSGLVLSTNPRIRDSVHLIDLEPFGEGWLVRIIPDDLERERELLHSRDSQME